MFIVNKSMDMELDKLEKRYWELAGEIKAVSDEMEAHMREMKDLLVGKCFIKDSWDEKVFIYKVKDVKFEDYVTLDGLDTRSCVIDSEWGYETYEREIEDWYDRSHYEHYIRSKSKFDFHRSYTYDNILIEFRKTFKEVSEEEYFEALKKETGIEDIDKNPIMTGERYR